MDTVGELEKSLERNGAPNPAPGTDDYVAHHVFAGTLYRDVPLLRDIGFRLNYYTNGMWLEKTYHPGQHPYHTRAIKNILSEIDRPTTPAERATAAAQVEKVLDATKQVLKRKELPLTYAEAKKLNPKLTQEEFVAQWEAAIRAEMKK